MHLSFVLSIRELLLQSACLYCSRSSLLSHVFYLILVSNSNVSNSCALGVFQRFQFLTQRSDLLHHVHGSHVRVQSLRLEN